MNIENNSSVLTLRGGYRRLGNTDVLVTPLCFGCAAAFARDLITDDFAVELFKHAYDLGIRTFDTGHSYGKAEERIGLALKKYPEIKRNEIVISTKFGTRVVDGKQVHDVSPEWIKESVNLSLSRMGITYIDVLLIHGGRISDLQNSETMDCLKQLKQEGLIRAFGINSFSTATIDFIEETACCDIVMLDYNVTKTIREPQIEKLYKKGVGVIAGQALAEGLFLNDLFKIKGKKDIWYLARTLGRKASRKLFVESQKYRFLGKIKGFSGDQVALKYVIDNEYISTASFGTCSMDHLERNVLATHIDIPEDIKNRIRRIDKS